MCDNASANDAMMDELEFTLAHFEGQGMRVQCILHVGNLVTKRILKQFDIPCNRSRMELAPEDEELHNLTEGSDVSEDYEMIDAIGGDFNNDNVDGRVDEDTLMSVNDQADLEQNICPVRTALAKVSIDLPYSPQAHRFMPDSQDGLQNHKLTNTPPACVGCCLQGGRLGREANPTRCANLLELKLQYGKLCC